MGAKEIRDLLLADENLEMGVITYTENNEYTGRFGSTRYIGTKKEMLFSNLYGVPYPKEIHGNHMYDSIDNVNSFDVVRADATLEVREMLAAEQKRRAELIEDMRKNPNKYTVPGIVKIGEESIEVTQQELIEAGLNPEQFGWISQRDFKRGKKPEYVTREIITPEETKLGIANKNVSDLRTSLSAIDIKALEAQEDELDKKSGTVKISERDSSEEARKSIQAIESRIRTNTDRKKLLEEHIKLISSVIAGEPGKTLDSLYEGMKSDFPNLKAEDILKYSSSTEKSILSLQGELGKMPEEFGIEKLLVDLQGLLDRCTQRLEELNANREEAREQHTDALKDEIRDTLLGRSGNEVGLVVNVHDNQFSNIYRETVFVGTKKEAILANRFGIPFEKELHTSHMHESIDIYNEFKGDSKLTLAQMNAIAGRKKEFEALEMQVSENPEKFIKSGIVVIAGIPIEVTLKELIEAGVNPNSFGWRTVEDYEQNKGGEVIATKVEEPEFSELSAVTQLVGSTRETLEGVDYKYLKSTIKDLDEDAQMQVKNEDSSRESLLNKSYIEDSIRRNAELKAKLEEYISKISAINFNDISSSIETTFEGMQKQYSNLEADEISKYDSETEKSINDLRDDIQDMMKKYQLPEILAELQEMLKKCEERATALESKKEEISKQITTAKTREIRGLMFGEEEQDLGIVTTIKNDEYRGQNSVEEHVGTKKEMKLSNLYGIPYSKEFHGNVMYDTIETYNVFEEDGLSEEQQAKVAAEAKRREDLAADAKANPDKYSKMGKVVVDGVEIEATMGELVEAGLDPEMMGWREPVREDRSVKGILQKMVRNCTKKMPKVAEAAEVVKRHLERNKDKGEQTYDE